jgi:hypothetical protein
VSRQTAEAVYGVVVTETTQADGRTRYAVDRAASEQKRLMKASVVEAR